MGGQTTRRVPRGGGSEGGRLSCFRIGVFIDAETGRPFDRAALPAGGFVSVIRLAKIEAGVLAAAATDARARRLRTVEALARLDLLPITGDAAHEGACLCFRLAQDRRRVNVNDLWIAAVALARGLPVVTQDADFEVLTDYGLRIVRA